MNVLEYAEGVEKLVDPMAVGTSHYMQTRLRKLPVWLQRKIVTSATKKADKMPFVVEPYCTFLFYEIPDPSRVQKFMPDGFVPAKAAVFEGGPEKYYGIVSMFRIHTSVFWGARAEYYLVAENTATGLLSWVMMDYINDSISYLLPPVIVKLSAENKLVHLIVMQNFYCCKMIATCKSKLSYLLDC